MDIYFLEATWTSQFRVYSYHCNTKLYAKYSNAIFGDQFYWRSTLNCMQNTQMQYLVFIFIGDWYLKYLRNWVGSEFWEFVFQTSPQDTFYTWHTHLGTCMEELVKPSFQAKIGTHSLFLIWVIYWAFL